MAEIDLSTVAGDLINRSEMFDEADLDTALARFDELSRPAPRLENAASRAYEHFWSAFAARDWDVMAGMLTDEICTDDRRRVVNAGVRYGRDAEIANMRGNADLGTRSDVLHHCNPWRASCTESKPLLGSRPTARSVPLRGPLVIEIDTDERIVARVTFDPDENDAAFAELDARYLAGGAAAHAHTWSVIARESSRAQSARTPRDDTRLGDIDHRQVQALAPGDLRAYLSAAFDDSVDNHLYVESVHRLTDLGAVVTHVAKGTSREGFDAEWRQIDAVTIDGDLISRYEMFDETDLDAALARFDELSRPAPRLENAASELAERFRAHFVARDWDAMAEILTDDIVHRRSPSGGRRRSTTWSRCRDRKHAYAADSVQEIWNRPSSRPAGSASPSFVFASRRGSGGRGVHSEVLGIVEVDADNGS